MINTATRALQNPLAMRPMLAAPKAPQGPQESVSISSPATPPGRNPTQPAKAEWSILVYSAGDNSLQSFLLQNLVDCQKTGSSSSLNVVSQFDTGASCDRYYIKQSNATTLDSPKVQSMGQVDMADPKVLSDFVQWGMKTYPADHYMLIISDHGDGWKGAVEDDSAGTWMSLDKIKQGLQDAQSATGKKLDILGFDACLMANSEVAEQLKGQASYMVASEETEGGAGWPYTRILSPQMLKSLNTALLLKTATTPGDFAKSIVQDATNDQGDLPTLSAFDMGQVDGMTSAVKGFADAIKATTTPAATLQGIAGSTQAFYDTNDLFDFADKVSKDGTITDAPLKKAAEDLKTAIGNAVIAEQHSTTQYPNAHGVTVNLGGVTPEYSSLDMPKATGWDAALNKIQGA